MKGLQHIEGRLSSRPTPPREKYAPKGLHSFRLESQQDGLIYVPPSYQPDQSFPLVLVLHGAGADAEDALNLLNGLIEERNDFRRGDRQLPGSYLCGCGASH